MIMISMGKISPKRSKIRLHIHIPKPTLRNIKQIRNAVRKTKTRKTKNAKRTNTIRIYSPTFPLSLSRRCWLLNQELKLSTIAWQWMPLFKKFIIFFMTLKRRGRDLELRSWPNYFHQMSWNRRWRECLGCSSFGICVKNTWGTQCGRGRCRIRGNTWSVQLKWCTFQGFVKKNIL